MTARRGTGTAEKTIRYAARWAMLVASLLAAGCTAAVDGGAQRESSASEGPGADDQLAGSEEGDPGDVRGGVSGASPELRFLEMDAGPNFACGLTTHGEPLCWGQTLGLGTPTDIELLSLSVGRDHVCGIDQQGSAVCWGGRNSDGELDPPAVRLEAIATGESHACGLSSEGEAHCWGSNAFGQTTPPSGQRFSAISVGSAHSCGLVEIDAWPVCWGSSEAPPGWLAAETISSGPYDTCTLDFTGKLDCWGDSFGGDLGDLSWRGTFQQLSTAGSATCAIDVEGAIECFGSSSLAEAAPRGAEFHAIAVGNRSYACALTRRGEAHCWGEHDGGAHLVPSSLAEARAAEVPATAQRLCPPSSGATVGWTEAVEGQVFRTEAVTLRHPASASLIQAAPPASDIVAWILHIPDEDDPCEVFQAYEAQLVAADGVVPHPVSPGVRVFDRDGGLVSEADLLRGFGTQQIDSLGGHFADTRSYVDIRGLLLELPSPQLEVGLAVYRLPMRSNPLGLGVDHLTSGLLVEVSALIHEPTDARAITPPETVTPSDRDSSLSTVRTFMAAWWNKDRALMEELAEPGAVDSFEQTPEGWRDYQINDDGSCSLGSSAAGACTVTLVSETGGGYTWLLLYREVNRTGRVVIYAVEPLGGGA